MSLRRTALALAATVVVTAPLWAGPAWLSIELGPNPFEPSTRGAFLLAHTFHHRGDAGRPVTGRAIGIVAGTRRTVELQFQPTSRPGVFALRNTWGDQGEWTLVITAEPDHGNFAEALVKVSGTRVIGVEFGSKPSRHAELSVEPRRFTDAEIEASLRNRG